MALTEKLQEKLESHLAETLIGFGFLAILGVTRYAEDILPERLIRWLEKIASAQTLLALSLIVVLLVAWVVYLSRRQPKIKVVIQEAKTPEQVKPAEPELTWRTDLGLWEDKAKSLYFCPKCKVQPLANHEVGWYCAPCHHLVESPAWKEKRKRELEEEQRRVDEWNNRRERI